MLPNTYFHEHRVLSSFRHVIPVPDEVAAGVGRARRRLVPRADALYWKPVDRMARGEAMDAASCRSLVHLPRLWRSIRRPPALVFALILVAIGLLYHSTSSASDVRRHSGRISDGEFWRMISEFSEPSGAFSSDNFLSNENAFQEVVPRLKALPSGGAYVGVGPEQNFTYIIALQPKVAFIVDIRRMNMAEHLLYKALLELSSDRADFLSRLFSRERPAHLGKGSSAQALFAAYRRAAPSDALFGRNLQAVRDRLVKQHGFRLATEDLMNLEYVYQAFQTAGPDMSYSFSTQWVGNEVFPTYAALMTEIDRQGRQHSFLATEGNFRALQKLETDNLIVPVVGDFAGDKTLRSVAQYLKERRLTVKAFYTSDVEQYLFSQGNAWERFFGNVAELPVDGSSTFIRSVNRGFRYLPGHPGLRGEMRLCPIAALLQAFGEGGIRSYDDLVTMSQ
jgi:hypothetical protein